MARRTKPIDIYHGRDPREIPTYGISEASHLLKIPVITLRSWIHGRDYPTTHGAKRFEPLIALPDPELALLSFINLMEAHVLDAIRYKDRIKLHRVRGAIEHLRDKYSSEHPLIDYRFQHDGIDLFTDMEKDVVNVSQSGQLAMREVISAYVKRISRDAHDTAIALYPYLKRNPDYVAEQKVVLIDPRISFGKAILVGIGVPTSVIADRRVAGETVAELAEDYGCEASEIEKAIDYERALPKAA
jgi:uncharacterized protein (DUF433 family)